MHTQIHPHTQGDHSPDCVKSPDMALGLPLMSTSNEPQVAQEA